VRVVHLRGPGLGPQPAPPPCPGWRANARGTACRCGAPAPACSSSAWRPRHVPVARLGRVHPQQQAVVRPAQFGTQCVPIWKRLEKRTHVAQVAFVKPLAKLLRQGLPQLRQQALAIGGPGLAALLELHDVPADVPTGLHLHHIDLAQHLLACLSDQAVGTKIPRIGDLRVERPPQSDP
jgi:hypothetical protein